MLTCCVAGWRWAVMLQFYCEFSAGWVVVGPVIMSLLDQSQGLVTLVVGLVGGLVAQWTVKLILQTMPWWVDGVLLELVGYGVGQVLGLQVELLLLE